MAHLVISLVDKDNTHVKRVAIEMPEDFEWETENAQVINFIEKGEVFLVAGLQIDAVNEWPPKKPKRKRPGT